MLKQVPYAALLLAALLTQHAQAGASAPVISGSYYEQNGTQGCAAVSSSGGDGSSGTANYPTVCQDLFSAPPAGKQIALDTVGCHLRVDLVLGATLKDAYLAQNVGGSISRKHPLAAQLQTQDSAYAYYTIDTYLGGGYVVVAPVRVVMDLTQGSVVTMDCQITGTLRSTPAP